MCPTKSCALCCQDAAETYSTEEKPSQWWVDLNEELKYYIAYSATVTEELQTWRMDMIACTEQLNTCMMKGDHGRDSKKTCYDIFTVRHSAETQVLDHINCFWAKCFHEFKHI